MKHLLLALWLLLVAHTSSGQLVRLTPDVAKDILGMAEKAKAENQGDSPAALGQFRKTFQTKYGAFFGCSRAAHSLPGSSIDIGEVAICVNSPAAWYGEQLLRALASEDDLAAVEPIDALVVMIAPKDAVQGSRQTVVIRQGEAVNNVIDWSAAKAVPPPFRQEQKVIDVENLSGKLEERTAWLFFFRIDPLDMTKAGEVEYWLDERIHGSLFLSSGVMNHMR